MGKQLLPELIEEILCFLPVKSLLRFTALSKPICSLINGRRFIKHHLAVSGSTETAVNQLLIMSDVLRHQLILSYDFDHSIIANQRSLTHPFQTHPLDLMHQVPVVGSCDGLLCLFSWNEGDIALVNPSTRKTRILPSVKRFNGECYHGFGYDPATEDYVIVKMSQKTLSKRTEISREIMIYSLKADAWRKEEEDFNFILNSDQIMATFICGKLHWQVNSVPQLLRDKTTNMVMGFDLGMKNGNLIPLPDSVKSTLSRLHLSTLGGCLSIITVQLYVNRANVWVMKEYGVKKSWEKLFSFVSGGGISVSTEDTVYTLAYSENKEEVLMYIFDCCMFWYDLKKKQARVVEHVPIRFGPQLTVGSLVSIDGGTFEEEKKEKPKPKAKVGKKRDDFLSKNFKLVL